MPNLSYKLTVVLAFFMHTLICNAQDSMLDNEYKIYNWPYSLQLRDSNDIKEYLNDKTKPLTANNDSIIHLLTYLIQQSKIINFPYGIARGQQQQAMYYSRIGQYDKAAVLYKSTVDYCLKHPQLSSFLHSLYNNLGVTYYSLGLNTQAAEYYFKALDYIGKDNGDVASMVKRYNNLATVLPDKEQALGYLKKAYRIADSSKDYRLMGIVLQNQSAIYETLKKNDEAYLIVEEAYKIGLEQNDYFLQYMSLIRWGYNFSNRGDYTQALSNIKKAKEIIHLVPEINKFHQNAHEMLLGNVYSNLNQYKIAEKTLLATLDTALKYSMQEQQTDIYQSLSQLYQKTGALQKAIDYQSFYINLKDSLRNERIEQGISLLEVEHRTSEKEKKILEKDKEVRTRNFQISIISSLAIILSILSFGLYRLMRQKQKSFKTEKELDILKAVLQGEEAERSRIAGEIHDGIMVNFSTLKMSLNAIWRKMHFTNEHHSEIESILKQFDSATKELRRSAHNLMPELLLREGLAGALQYFCYNSQQVVAIDFQQYGSLLSIPSQHELMLYRVVQELIQNALKYSEATFLLVQLDVSEEDLALTVEDNGIGFDFSPTNLNKHMGLHKIRSRIVSLGGNMNVKTAVGKGTSIYIEIPLKNIKAIKK